MVLEHAILPVKPGQEDQFVEAFAQARPIISRQKGFRSLKLLNSIESQNEYLLLVEWDAVEDHTIGFRQSEDYVLWKDLLHRFYEPFPVVEHFHEVPVAE